MEVDVSFGSEEVVRLRHSDVVMVFGNFILEGVVLGVDLGYFSHGFFFGHERYWCWWFLEALSPLEVVFRLVEEVFSTL